MLISSKTTQPIWFFFFFYQEKRTTTEAITTITNQKYCSVKMREPKKQMLGTMESPLYR